jgi:hypothetical protein
MQKQASVLRVHPTEESKEIREQLGILSFKAPTDFAVDPFDLLCLAKKLLGFRIRDLRATTPFQVSVISEGCSQSFVSVWAQSSIYFGLLAA